MQSAESAIPADLRAKFEFHNFGHALEILLQACPNEWSDFASALGAFSLPLSEVVAAGGNESAIPKRFDDHLYPRGWREIRITGDLLIRMFPRKSAHRRGAKNRNLQPGRSQVNLIRAEKREHSRKPDEIIKVIESCSPGPYLELFARGDRPNWAMWGNQATAEYEPNWKTYANHTTAAKPSDGENATAESCLIQPSLFPKEEAPEPKVS